MKYYYKHLNIILASVIWVGASCHSLVHKQSVLAQVVFTQKTVRFVPAQPKLPKRGTPKSDSGTGSRGDCMKPTGEHSLTRLVGGAPLNLSVSDHPTIWFYLPYTKNEISKGEFSLQLGREEIYQQSFLLPDQPGIVGIQIPDQVEPLASGENYRWYFDVLCDSENEDASPASLTGSVRRIEMSDALRNDLARASPLSQVASYARHHIWYETLQGLAHLRLVEQDNQALTATWRDVLTDPAVGLGAFAEEPLLGYLQKPNL